MDGINKRGFTHAEAIAYVGVKRRTFDDQWRPRLVAMRRGSCLIFDRRDLDRLFDEFKEEAAAGAGQAANDAHNGARNGRSIRKEKGEREWAKQHGVSTPKPMEAGRSTNGGEALDFATAASAVLKKRNAG